MASLNGKTAVITGGATGIGGAAAKRFVKEGAFVFIFGRRQDALDAALAEVAQGRKSPSVAWRHEYSLLLGLERLLSEEEPRLVDGTVLSAHQVDALSGTLTALLAEAQRGAVVAGPVVVEVE